MLPGYFFVIRKQSVIKSQANILFAIFSTAIKEKHRGVGAVTSVRFMHGHQFSNFIFTYQGIT